MSGRSTKRTRANVTAIDILEAEAKEFSTKGKRGGQQKTLTPRQHLAGLALAGLLARSQGLLSKNDIIREAFEWADSVLDV